MKLVEDGAVAVGTSFSGENADSPYEDAVADTSASHQPRDHGVKGLGIPSLLGHRPFLVASFPSYCSGKGYCSPWSHDLRHAHHPLVRSVHHALSIVWILGSVRVWMIRRVPRHVHRVRRPEYPGRPIDRA